VHVLGGAVLLTWLAVLFACCSLAALGSILSLAYENNKSLSS
jgi:hypothetical protein